MHNLTFTSSQLSSLPSLQTNFTDNALAKEYPAVSVISSENFFPKCIICLQIPEDPVSLCNKINITIDERHLFCRKCTTNYENSKCPLCNDSLTENIGFTEDIQARKLISDIKYNVTAICPKNCGNILSFNKIETHLKICNGKQALSERTLSAEASSKAVIQCSKCNLNLTATEQEDLAQHTTKCPESFVEYKPKNSMFPSLVVRNRLLNIDKYKEQAQDAINLIHSDLTSKKCSLIASLPIYEFSKDNKSANSIKFIYGIVKVTINEQCLLSINTEFKDSLTFNFLESTSFSDSICKIRVPLRFRVNKGYGFMLSNHDHPDLKYRLSIYANLSARDSILVCQQAFTYSSIKTLNSMYSDNKIDTPQSFKDAKEFFTNNGLSKLYTDKFGSSMIWRIELAETTSA